jgi:hypothetical protein
MAVVEDIAREDWRLRDAAELTDDVILEAAKDAQWRIRHLYWVIDKNKQEVLFRPWPEQEKFLRRLWYRNIILKARQRGFSTLIQLMMLDACMFTPNCQRRSKTRPLVGARFGHFGYLLGGG